MVETNVLGMCRLPDFDVLEESGKGSNGMVYRVRCINPRQPHQLAAKEYALKLCFAYGTLQSSLVRERFQVEFRELAALPHHSNINRYYGQFMDVIDNRILSFLPEVAKPYAVDQQAKNCKMQFFMLEHIRYTLDALLRYHFINNGAGGQAAADLAEQDAVAQAKAARLLEVPVSADAKPPSERFILRVLRDVCAGLLHCLTYRVVHLDIKPDNILIRGEVDLLNNPAAVICDFGCARRFRDVDMKDQLQNPDVGNLGHLAPEIYNHIMPVQMHGGHADFYGFSKQPVFELGVLGYEMFMFHKTGQPRAVKGVDHPLGLYPSSLAPGSMPVIYDAARIKMVPPEICTSQRLRDLLKRMVLCDPRQRPEPRDVYNDLLEMCA